MNLMKIVKEKTLKENSQKYLSEILELYKSKEKVLIVVSPEEVKAWDNSVSRLCKKTEKEIMPVISLAIHKVAMRSLEEAQAKKPLSKLLKLFGVKLQHPILKKEMNKLKKLKNDKAEQSNKNQITYQDAMSFYKDGKMTKLEVYKKLENEIVGSEKENFIFRSKLVMRELRKLRKKKKYSKENKQLRLVKNDETI